jgi:hypothetical protein
MSCVSVELLLCCVVTCSILSWAIAVMAGLVAVQTLGINIQPLLAVGGASSLIIGLATQTLLTNAVMGVSIFLSRPFVPGDSITVQAAGAILVSGVVEKVTPMRTLLRTDDDVLVTLPNKVRALADLVILHIAGLMRQEDGMRALLLTSRNALGIAPALILASMIALCIGEQ